MVNERIKQYLKEHEIKLEALAEKIDVSCLELSEKLNSTTAIDCINYYFICKTLDVDMEYLLEVK